MATTSATDRVVTLQSLGFQQLSDIIHLYTPPLASVATTEAKANNNSPGLIVLCTWAFAQEKHIAKYLRWYIQIYPTSQILVLQSDTGNLLWRPDAWQSPIFEPAVLAVKNYYLNSKKAGNDISDESSAKVLLHLFSNGGGYTAVQFTKFYGAHSASDQQSYPKLSINAIVLDSSPGRPNGQLAVKALMAGLAPKSNGLRRTIGLSLTYLIVGITGVLHETGISYSAVDKAWQVLKDPKAPFLKESMSRSYIFSDADEMIEPSDVRLHAELSIQALERAGATNAVKVRCEEFLGTSHVNHMLSNPERYWNIVKETWAAATSSSLSSPSST